MECRTNQILFFSVLLCLTIFACQLSPIGNAGEAEHPQEPVTPIRTLVENVTGLFPKSKGEVNIGGVEPRGFSLVGQLGGSAIAVAVKNDLAVLGQGPRVVTLDVSDPSSPKYLGESQVLPGLVMGLQIVDRYAYAATMFGGLYILDINDPSDIQLISHVEPKVPGCDGLTIQGNIAYLACNPGGLFIVDTSSVKKPKVLFEDPKPSGASFSLAFLEKRIYMVNTSQSALEIFDVNDPSKPEKVGAFAFSDLPSGKQNAAYISSVRTCGEFLCLAAFQDGLVILDVSTPSKPSIIGQSEMQVASGLVVEGNTVYLADDMDGVHAIDISDPGNPTQIGLLPTSVGGWEFTVKERGERGLFVAGSKLYITDPAYGLTIATLENPASPERIASYMTPLPDALSDIRLSDKTAFITGRNSGFRTVDISQPEKPKELFYDDERKNLYSQNPSGLVVRENLAYVADKNYPFHIYDVSSPSGPKELGALFDKAAPDGAFDLVLNGDLAYLSGWGGKDAFYPGKGIWVVDISDPNDPAAVNFEDVANEDWILTQAKDHLYALDATKDLDHDGQKEPLSLRVFDLSNPAKPTEVQTIPISEAMNLTPMDMTTDGELLYIHIIPNSVLVYDLASPENPKKIAVIPIPGGMPDILKDGKYLYLGGTTAYDITNPDKPNFAGLTGNLQAWDLIVEKDLVYVITTFQGLYIFKFDK